MGYFNTQIITDDGLAIMSRGISGESRVVFTRIKTGSGEYSIKEIADLKKAVSLKSEMQQFDISSIKTEDETIRIKAVISNENLEESYFIREVGVYAKENDGEEKLVSISICNDNPTLLQKYDEIPIQIPITNFIAHSGDGNFEIVYSSDVYATAEELHEEIERAKSAEKANADNLSSHIDNKDNPHRITKEQVGLGNVENKSSATIRGEITSSNVTTALGYTPINRTLIGSNSGLAELDENGKVPSSQLPSYVDDVLEYSSKSSFPTTGEAGKIYIDTSTNLTYRWSGSAYREISPSLALGETSSTAYRGDRGKEAYEHSQKISGNPHGVTKSDIGLGNVENTADADKSVKYAGSAGSATEALKLNLPREGTDANWLPDTGGTMQMRELSNNSSNLPEANFFQVIANRSIDGNYGSQLAMGMTTNNLYFRNYQEAKFNNWRKVAFADSISSITRFIHKLISGKMLYVTSENSGDTIYCGGRGFTRTSSEKVIIGKCATGTTETVSSYFIIAKSKDDLGGTDFTSYGSYTTKTVITPSGNTVYVATMGAAWSSPNYSVVSTCGGTSYTISEFSMYSRGDGSNLDNTWIYSVADAELFSDLKSFANIVEASLQYPLRIQDNCLIKKVSTDANYSFYLGSIESSPKLLMRSYTNVFQLFPDKNYSDSWKTNIGHSSYRFGDGYFTNVYNSSGVITTSDRNKKHDIEEITDEFSKAIIDGMIPSSFKFNDGSSGRTHFGIIAQDLEKLLEALGISTTDFAPLVKEYPDKEVEIENPDYDENDENSQKYIKKLEKDYAAEPIYNVRYEEFIMILVKYCQGLKKKDLELEQRMSELEERLCKLEENQ